MFSHRKHRLMSDPDSIVVIKRTKDALKEIPVDIDDQDLANDLRLMADLISNNVLEKLKKQHVEKFPIWGEW